MAAVRWASICSNSSMTLLSILLFQGTTIWRKRGCRRVCLCFAAAAILLCLFYSVTDRWCHVCVSLSIFLNNSRIQTWPLFYYEPQTVVLFRYSLPLCSIPLYYVLQSVSPSSSIPLFAASFCHSTPPTWIGPNNSVVARLNVSLSDIITSRSTMTAVGSNAPYWRGIWWPVSGWPPNRRREPGMDRSFWCERGNNGQAV